MSDANSIDVTAAVASATHSSTRLTIPILVFMYVCVKTPGLMLNACLLRRLIIDGVVDSRILHFIPCLFPPVNLFGGIGIRLVIHGVVVVRDGLQLRSLRYRKRTRKDIASLPIEVIMRHGQHGFGAPVRIN